MSKRKLGQVASKIGSGATPTGGSNAYKEAGISLIRSQNVLDFEFTTNGLAFIDSEQAEALQNVAVEKNDILLNITGDSVARCCIVPDFVLPARVNQHVSIIRLNPEIANYQFIFYQLQYLKDELLMQAEVGATRKALTKGMLEDLDIYLPSLKEQKAIAILLGSLDSKIDLLKNQCRTLDALAQSLFRHWFSEGPQKDWEEKSLDEIATYLNGLACQNYPAENEVEKLPVLKIKELRNGISDESDWATSKVPEEFIVVAGDVIFSWSGSLMVKVWNGEKCLLNQHLFKVTSEQFPKWFYYFWTTHHLENFIAIAESKATTMGHIKREDLSGSKVLIPTRAELREMDQVISPLIDKIVLNYQQINKLRTLRDSLLRKLMNGEARVRLDD